MHGQLVPAPLGRAHLAPGEQYFFTSEQQTGRSSLMATQPKSGLVYEHYAFDFRAENATQAFQFPTNHTQKTYNEMNQKVGEIRHRLGPRTACKMLVYYYEQGGVVQSKFPVVITGARTPNYAAPAGLHMQVQGDSMSMDDLMILLDSCDQLIEEPNAEAAVDFFDSFEFSAGWNSSLHTVMNFYDKEGNSIPGTSCSSKVMYVYGDLQDTKLSVCCESVAWTSSWRSVNA